MDVLTPAADSALSLPKEISYEPGSPGIYQLAPLDEGGRYHSKMVRGLWLKVEWVWARPSVLEVLREWKLV